MNGMSELFVLAVRFDKIKPYNQLHLGSLHAPSSVPKCVTEVTQTVL